MQFTFFTFRKLPPPATVKFGLIKSNSLNINVYLAVKQTTANDLSAALVKAKNRYIFTLIY